MEISKRRHPELSDFVHEKIVEKFYDLDGLVLFIFNALDFQAASKIKYGRKLTNKIALSITKNTTISEKGIVNTDYFAVEKETQKND